MELKLGSKVRINKEFKGKSLGGSRFGGSGYIYSIQLENAVIGGRVICSVRIPSGSSYSYLEDELELVKQQTLYAYTDKKDEVHWITRLYTKTTNFTRAEQFDKLIDL